MLEKIAVISVYGLTEKDKQVFEKLGFDILKVAGFVVDDSFIKPVSGNVRKLSSVKWEEKTANFNNLDGPWNIVDCGFGEVVDVVTGENSADISYWEKKASEHRKRFLREYQDADFKLAD
jgi:hypothetical protein